MKRTALFIGVEKPNGEEDKKTQAMDRCRLAGAQKIFARNVAGQEN
jgi:hypothetical protein